MSTEWRRTSSINPKSADSLRCIFRWVLFDVNLEIGSLYEPHDDISVAVPRDSGLFSNLFLASEQKGSVVNAVLDKMVAFYKRNDTRPDLSLGSETLAEAIRELNATVQVNLFPLKEIVEYPSAPWITDRRYPFDTVPGCADPLPLNKIPRRLFFNTIQSP
jgi:hypothetical protein